MREEETKKNYTYQTMREERQYGLYWYAWLWRILRPILVAAGAAVIVIGLLSTVWGKVYDAYLSPVDAQDDSPVEFSVESGQSLTRIAGNLQQEGLIRSKTVFKYYCDFAGMGQKLQAGTYSLGKNMTIQQIADRLTTGDGNPLVRNITMIPGWTIEDFAADLLQKGVLDSKEEFLALCRNGTAFSNYYYIADVLKSKTAASRKYVLEGYLAPDTYEVYTSATAQEIISRLLSQTERVFSADMQDVASEAGFTMDEIITLASMIEKEAKPNDFAKVSAVFHNRLSKKMPLGSDVTIHYATGTNRLALTDSDLSVSSPYNTYKNRGLPPGAVCNPSADAIMAALYPDESYLAEGYLYFCATDPATGELHFSRTQAEHDQAVAIYRPLWIAYDESRGAK